jgi:hypothetical protein
VQPSRQRFDRLRISGRENATAAPELTVGDEPQISRLPKSNPAVRVLDVRAPEGAKDSDRDDERQVRSAGQDPWEALETKLREERETGHPEGHKDAAAAAEEELRDERVSILPRFALRSQAWRHIRSTYDATYIHLLYFRV